MLFNYTASDKKTAHTYSLYTGSRILEFADGLNLVTCNTLLGDAQAAVEARIRIGWNKFRQLVTYHCLPIRTYHLSLLYSSCVQKSMLHGSETWPVRKENEVALQ